MDWKDEAFKRIDVIAKKLGVAATEVWSVLTQQAIVDGKAYAIRAAVYFAGVLCLLAVVGYAALSPAWHVKEITTKREVTHESVPNSVQQCPKGMNCFYSGGYSYTDTPVELDAKDWTVGQYVKSIVGLAAAIMGMILLCTAVDKGIWAYKYLGNPKYWAIQDILDALK